MKFYALICLLSTFLVFAPSVEAARQALVIGNNAYQGGEHLRGKPINDANDIKDALEKVGFRVFLYHDLDKDALETAIQDFSRALRPGDDAVIYYSGHGVQYGEENYLVPVGALHQVAVPGHLDNKTVAVDYLLDILEIRENAINIVILDACRDNPFKGIVRGELDDGLQAKAGPSGTLLAYATKAGAVALTGAGRNSPYAAVLKQELTRPGQSVFDMFTEVRKAVRKHTGGSQEPAFYSELNGSFCFVDCDNPNDERMENLQAQLAGLQADIARLKRDRETEIAEIEAKREQARQLALRLEGRGRPWREPGSGSGYQPGQTFRDCAHCPEMVMIPGGWFMMGSEDGRSEETPVHEVRVDGFAMGKYEVTFAEYDRFAQATGRDKPDDEGWGRGNRPVINVSWHDAVAYADWLSRETGKNYRLPTEAEWEYAARGGTQTRYWWGNAIGDNRANCDGCGSRWDDKQTAPVGSFDANPFGLFDTAGNVWEWTKDNYSRDAYSHHQHHNPIYTAGGSDRVVRGSSWDFVPANVRCAVRGYNSPGNRSGNLGFRLLRTD